MVTVLGNKHGDLNLEPGQGCFVFHFHANALRKGIILCLFPPDIGK